MRIQSLAAAALLLSTAPAVAAEPEAPRPTGNPGTWVTANDYPAAALREEAQGAVRFVLGVAADGSVTDCTVQESSGNAHLDTATCELIRARARFTPAKDSAGQAIAGTWSSSVRWQIPDTARTLPPIMLVSYRFVVEKDGSVSSCEVLSDSEPVSGPGGKMVSPGAAACANIPKSAISPMTDKDGQPVRSVTTMTFKTERTQLSD